MSLPATEDGLYAWLLALMSLHLGVAYLWCFVAHRRLSDGSSRSYLTRVFDAATFSTSATLLAGILEPTILLLIGNTKPFLLVAGLVGTLYGLQALRPLPAP